MKRAEALRPLSREHLRALLVARSLKASEDVEAARVEFLEFWLGEGQIHFRVEEEVMLPVWSRWCDVDRAGVRRMLEEHLSIRADALRMEEGSVNLQHVRQLGHLLHDHVRFEERQLFPMIEDALTDEQLEKLAAAIEEAESAAG